VTREVREGDNVREERRWEFRFEEQYATDFYLVNPSIPSVSVYVPGSQAPIKLHSNMSSAYSGAGAVSIFQHEQLSPSLQVIFNSAHKRAPANKCTRSGIASAP